MLASRGTVAAQTVIVRHVPAKAAVQVIVGEAAPVDAAQGTDGNFRATINAIPAGATEISVLAFVDKCEASVRIVMAPTEAYFPAPGANCTRQQVAGIYVVRPRTTLVFNLAGQSPTLLTSQGPAPSQWLRDAVVSQTPGATAESPAVNYRPTGLMLYGTGNLSHYGNFGDADCGTTTGTQCTVHGTVPAVTAGAEYWLTPYLGAFGSYSKEGDATTSGSGTNFSFSSQLDTDFATVGGEALLPVRRVTFFATVGATHHRATWTTTNTIGDTTVTVDGVAQTFSGGTETFIVKTQGWNLAVGGGANFWMTDRLGIRVGLDYSIFKGNDLGTSAAKIDDTMLSLKFGVIFKVPKVGKF